MQRLKNQVALVTGASSGIGSGVAKSLASEGAKVVVNYARVRKALKRLSMRLSPKGEKRSRFKRMLARKIKYSKCLSMMYEHYDTIDILVNNAGLQKDSTFIDMSLKDWNTVIHINLTGQFLCAWKAAKEFIQRGVVPEKSCSAGKIICMSSVHEVIPWAGHCSYAASKGGIMLLMKSMAQELAPYKIRVNSIGPGVIKTPINQDAWSTPEAEADLLTLLVMAEALVMLAE